MRALVLISLCMLLGGCSTLLGTSSRQKSMTALTKSNERLAASNKHLLAEVGDLKGELAEVKTINLALESGLLNKDKYEGAMVEGFSNITAAVVAGTEAQQAAVEEAKIAWQKLLGAGGIPTLGVLGAWYTINKRRRNGHSNGD